ncbi:MAG TPA: hypothetical protein VKU41_03135 [Polyangiaceae bacterium]|nr:hypothetical protein [Polyangiaceae bacterium]
MKTMRRLCCTLRLLSAAAGVAAPCLLGAAVIACEDDNDPKTWVKRLDDPAQRANAIKRLTQFYEDDMTRASNDASAPEVKELLAVIVDPLAKQYTGGGLDDKTRVDLMKFLAETHDPRTQPAIAKALKDFEMGKTDDEVRVACESVNAMAKSGVKLEQTVIDELWNVFSKFQLSKTNSERLYKAIHEAIVNVHDASYGDKAIEKLKGTVIPDSVDSQKDQLMWWQLTSVQVLRELKYTKAVKPLIITLLTPTKTATLGATIQFVLLKMGKDSEVELIKALNGEDPDYVKAGEGFEDKAAVGVVAEVLAQIGRAPGRDAMLARLPNAETDTVRTELAQALVQMPPDPRVEPAFLAAYNKLTWDSSDKLVSIKPRAALAQQSANFYDPKLLDWLLKEMKKAPDFQSKMLQIEPAVKIMTVERVKDVADAMAKLKKETPADIFNLSQQMFDNASSALNTCKADTNCYIGLLDQPIPTNSPTANYKAIKATWMAVIFGSANAAATRAELLKHLDKVKNTGARIAMCEAIDELAPQGDPAAADALDKIIESDAKSGEAELIASDNTVAQVAWRLRVRGQ